MERFLHLTVIILIGIVFHTVLAVDPIVEIKEPVDYSGQNILTASKNSDVSFLCVVENKKPKSQVKWTRINPEGSLDVGTDTSSTDPQKYTIINMTPNSWRLTIQNVQSSDEGKYECKIQLDTKLYSRDFRKLRVVEKPQIVDMDTSSDTSIDDAEKLVLTCRAQGVPNPKISWTRLAGADLPNGGIELWSPTLLISTIHPSDRGKYICRASNEAGSDKRVISVSVRFPPLVSSEQPMVVQATGYRKELICTIEAYPEVEKEQITWTRIGTPIREDKNKYEKRYTLGAFNTVTSRYIIKSVSQEDFGTYVCKATNTKGTKEVRISLEQSSEPTPDRTGRIRSSAPVNRVTGLFVVCILIVLCHY